MAADGLTGTARQPQIMSFDPLNHAGGCQTVGPVVVVGLEDHDENLSSRIAFWNVLTGQQAASPPPIDRQTVKYLTTAALSG